MLFFAPRRACRVRRCCTASLRLIGQALALPATVRAYRARRRRERAHAALAARAAGVLRGALPRAPRSEAALAFETGPTPGLAALLAARAAHQMRDFERATAGSSAPTAPATPADRAPGQPRGTGARRARLRRRARRAAQPAEPGRAHIATARMLLRAERGAGAWDEVLRLAGQLAKRDAIAPALAEEYKVQANVELLDRSADDAGGLRATLARHCAPRDQVASARRRRGRAPRHRARPGGACARDHREGAGRRLELAARDASTASCPRSSPPAERPRKRASASSAPSAGSLERNRDPELLATLGRLCAQAELWGKARSFLEASLSFEESRAARTRAGAAGGAARRRAAEAQRHFRRAAELP